MMSLVFCLKFSLHSKDIMKRTTYQKSETRDPGPRASTDGTPGLGTPRPQISRWDPGPGTPKVGSGSQDSKYLSGSRKL